jgi:hypothetical protein
MRIAAIVGFVAFRFAIAAEPAGPADPTEPEKPNPFQITDLDAYLQLESRYDYQKVDQQREPYPYAFRRNSQSDRQFQLEETAGMRMAGYYLYRELLAYDVQVGMGLDQIWAKERGYLENDSHDDCGWVNDYAVNLALLSRKLISFDVYTSHQDERITRMFLPSLDHEMWRDGVTARFNGENYPMELTVQRNKDHYSGGSDVFGDEEEEYHEALIHYAGTMNFTQHHRLQIDAQRSRIDQEYFGSRTEFKTTRNTLNVDDRIEFGSRHQHVFETILEYEQDQGDLPRDRLAVGPQLTLNHTDDLSTRFKYQFDKDGFEGADVRSNRFDAELTHLLAKALTTTADLYVSREDSNDGTTADGAGGLIRWAFNRKNSLGTFSAAMGYQYDNTRIRYDDTCAVVIDEVVCLRDPLWSYLAHPNVITSSIIVTDLKRTHIYRLGHDYTIVTRHGQAAIARTIFGAIADKQSVLVSYRFRIADKADYRTHQFDVRVQQDFRSGWTPYYDVKVRWQDLDTNDPYAYEANNMNRHRLGVTYRRERWSAGGEMEFNDETVDPYNAIHFNTDWAVLIGYPDRLDLRAGISRYWFQQCEERLATLLDLSVDYRRPLSVRMDFTSRVVYRYEDDTIQGTTNGVDVKTGCEYKIGQLTFSCDLEYDLLDIAGTGDNGVSLWFKVRRDFPNLLGR